ncbi:MAG: 3-deoxy-D-manno-octulosonic acid transferase [Alteromonadaceae bacterium]|nr:3-deoxy-D-manno-octulosonic acid transferase [Alteromonadaceae bacterium]
MALFVYSLLICLALPFVLFKLWWRSRHDPVLRQHWRERLGYVRCSSQPVLWIHAVSVGETIAAAPLVKALRARHPQACILVTAMTHTGRERAQALFGDSVDYAYVPYDYPGAIARFLERVRPRVLIVMETELWPNIITRTKAAGTPVIVANARLSERSARGYRRVSWLSRALFAQLDWVAAQAEADARRFIDVGARPDAVAVTGSVKFDITVSETVRQQSRALRTQLGETRPVWIAASTHEGEDELLLRVHHAVLQRWPEALLILVPRHPERFRSVARLVKEEGYSLARRSREDSACTAQVYLGDTMGELLMLFGVADAAFIGGSLITRGGHNPLEAAAWGIPVLTGPHVFNFIDVFERLDEGGGLVRIASSKELEQHLVKLLGDRRYRETIGTNGAAVLEANQGALQRLLQGIEARIDP